LAPQAYQAYRSALGRRGLQCLQHAGYPQYGDGPIFIRRRLHLGYNPKTRDLPILQKCPELVRFLRIREIGTAKDQHNVIEHLKRHKDARLNFVANSLVDLFFESHAYLMEQPKRRSAQQARNKQIRSAYGAASACLRPAS